MAAATQRHQVGLVVDSRVFAATHAFWDYMVPVKVSGHATDFAGLRYISQNPSFISKLATTLAFVEPA